MQSTAFARLFYRSCRQAIDLSRSPLPDTLVAVMRGHHARGFRGTGWPRGAGRGGGAARSPRAVAAARAGLGGRGRLPLGPSRGSVFTVREAARTGKSAAVVLAGGGATLPSFPDGQVARMCMA